jgi:hypothetical protein
MNKLTLAVICASLLLSACSKKDEEICQKAYFEDAEYTMNEIKNKYQKSVTAQQAALNILNKEKEKMSERWKERSCVDRRVDRVENTLESLSDRMKSKAFRNQ